MHDNEIVDTQILIKVIQEDGIEDSVHNTWVASVTAKEFLLAQAPESAKPAYYVLHPARYPGLEKVRDFGTFPSLRKNSVIGHAGNPKWAKAAGRKTDQITIDFRGDFPAYREYGDQAITMLINGHNNGLFRLSIAHLPKEKQKLLLDRFAFILTNNVRCMSVKNTTVKIGLELFSTFLTKYTCKKNPHNTVNDLLVLATVIENGGQLRTRDDLLARFAEEHCGVVIVKRGNELVLNFGIQVPGQRIVLRESKGYVNRGWTYSVRHQRAVAGR